MQVYESATYEKYAVVLKNLWRWCTYSVGTQTAGGTQFE